MASITHLNVTLSVQSLAYCCLLEFKEERGEDSINFFFFFKVLIFRLFIKTSKDLSTWLY